MTDLTDPNSIAGRKKLAAKRLAVAVVVSLALHAATLLELPAMPQLKPVREPESVALNVQLAPAAPPPQAAPEPRQRQRAIPPPPPPRAPAERPQRSAPRSAPPPVATAPVPEAIPLPSRPAEPDLLAYVEARRRARGATAEQAPPPAPRAEPSENERASRAAAANIAGSQSQVFGYDPSKSGGVFLIERLTTDYAEFTFTGWNTDVRHYTKQLIEVQRGTEPDIRIAVVRRIIAIIRRYEPEEFSWDSQRLGRTVMLSSRQRDNAGLEEFMMLEFFTGPNSVRR